MIFLLVFNMLRLLDSKITKYLELLEDKEDGLDGSDSKVENKGHYYPTARDVFRDLGISDEGENVQPDEVDADLPLIIDNDENMPYPPVFEAEEAAPYNRSQGIFRRPLVWRKRNLVTAEDSFIIREKTPITEALMSCNMPYDFISNEDVPRGFNEVNVATVDDIDVSAVVWKDNNPVNLLSTYVGAEPATTVTRFYKSKKK